MIMGLCIKYTFEDRLTHLEHLLMVTAKGFPAIYALEIDVKDVWGKVEKPHTMLFLLDTAQQQLDEAEITLEQFGHLIHAAAIYLKNSPKSEPDDKQNFMKRMNELVSFGTRFNKGRQHQRERLGLTINPQRMFNKHDKNTASNVNEPKISLSL